MLNYRRVYAYASSVISSDRVNCTMHLWSEASFYIEENVGSCRLGGFNVNAGAQLRCDCHILPLLSAKSHGSIRVHLHPSPLVPFWPKEFDDPRWSKGRYFASTSCSDACESRAIAEASSSRRRLADVSKSWNFQGTKSVISRNWIKARGNKLTRNPVSSSYDL